jgi:nucleotide-binding universal stress UspA family protein
MFKRILVPVDGSELSTRAAKTAMTLAREHGASLVLLHVTLPYVPQYAGEIAMVDSTSEKLYDERIGVSAKQILDTVEGVARAEGIATERALESHAHPDEAIAKVVKAKHCDLVVIATHGRGAVARFFMGSVTTRLLTRCSVPILVYRDESMVAQPIGTEDD